MNKPNAKTVAISLAKREYIVLYTLIEKNQNIAAIGSKKK
jgi:hypothetical protein